MRKHARRVSLLISAQTLYHPNRMAGRKPLGEVVDDLVREKCLAKRQNADFCICCGAYVPEGRMISPACEAKNDRKE